MERLDQLCQRKAALRSRFGFGLSVDKDGGKGVEAIS
jgi:hypothetical protein